jgi:hypothetical protein
MSAIQKAKFRGDQRMSALAFLAVVKNKTAHFCNSEPFLRSLRFGRKWLRRNETLSFFRLRLTPDLVDRRSGRAVCPAPTPPATNF